MFDRTDYDNYFKELFWNKRFFVQSVIRKYVKNPDRVDDIVQQTFLKIYLNIKSSIQRIRTDTSSPVAVRTMNFSRNQECLSYNDDVLNTFS